MNTYFWDVMETLLWFVLLPVNVQQGLKYIPFPSILVVDTHHYQFIHLLMCMMHVLKYFLLPVVIRYNMSPKICTYVFSLSVGNLPAVHMCLLFYMHWPVRNRFLLVWNLTYLQLSVTQMTQVFLSHHFTVSGNLHGSKSKAHSVQQMQHLRSMTMPSLWRERWSRWKALIQDHLSSGGCYESTS